MTDTYPFSVGGDRLAYVRDMAGVDISTTTPDKALDWLRRMVLIRLFEEALGPLVQSGEMPGGIHAAIGQEAVAVGVIDALAPDDIVASPHRPHHHALAKGLSLRSVMAELFGRATGCAGGRGGTMHLADFDKGYFGGNGVVGASLGLATGAALAAKLRGRDQIAVGFFGDGGANVGRVWESVNLAALWKLPLVAVCENNLYAISTDMRDAFAGESIARRASGFGITTVQVDGQDVGAVFAAASEARSQALLGDGPTFVEAVTYRHEGHTLLEADRMDGHQYRAEEERLAWRAAADPIDRLQRSLRSADVLSDEEFETMVAQERELVADAISFAKASPWPQEESNAPVVGMSFEAQERNRWTPRQRP